MARIVRCGQINTVNAMKAGLELTVTFARLIKLVMLWCHRVAMVCATRTEKSSKRTIRCATLQIKR